MVIQAETTHSHEGIFSEANGTRSRENIIVVSGQDLPAMAVVGMITASSKYAWYDDDAVDGSEVAAGILLSAVDASSADAPGLILESDAEVKQSALVWEGTQTAPQIVNGEADLLARGVKVRAAV